MAVMNKLFHVPSPTTCEFNSCTGCEIDDFDFVCLIPHPEQLLTFFLKHGVLSCHVLCEKCGARLTISRRDEHLFEYRCQRIIRREMGPNRRPRFVSEKCGFRRSAFAGTFFEQSRLGITDIVKLTHIFLSDIRARVSYATEEMRCSPNTAVDWFSFCREVIMDYVASESRQIGGPGVVVEIDEAKLGKRKYERGRILSGQWIVGGIQRRGPGEPAKVFIVAVPDRKAATLMEVIRTYVREGSTIMTDCWKGYEALREEAFRHFTVNHSIHLVDPDTGAHTQTVERLWVEVRRRVPRAGLRADHLPGYLSEVIFRKMVPGFKARRHIFWQAVATIYPPEDHTLE